MSSLPPAYSLLPVSDPAMLTVAQALTRAARPFLRAGRRSHGTLLRAISYRDCERVDCPVTALASAASTICAWRPHAG